MKENLQDLSNQMKKNLLLLETKIENAKGRDAYSDSNTLEEVYKITNFYRKKINEILYIEKEKDRVPDFIKGFSDALESVNNTESENE